MESGQYEARLAARIAAWDAARIGGTLRNAEARRPLSFDSDSAASRFCLCPTATLELPVTCSMRYPKRHDVQLAKHEKGSVLYSQMLLPARNVLLIAYSKAPFSWRSMSSGMGISHCRVLVLTYKSNVK